MSLPKPATQHATPAAVRADHAHASQPSTARVVRLADHRAAASAEPTASAQAVPTLPAQRGMCDLGWLLGVVHQLQRTPDPQRPPATPCPGSAAGSGDAQPPQPQPRSRAGRAPEIWPSIAGCALSRAEVETLVRLRMHRMEG